MNRKMFQAARVGVAAVVAAGFLLVLGLPRLDRARNAAAIEATGQVLAPLGRQVAWLSMAAPSRQILTSLSDPAYVTDVAATLTAPFAVVAVSAPFGQQGTAGDDRMRLDTSSGTLTPLLRRSSGQESLAAPSWWPDGSGVPFERDDLNSPLPAYTGESTPRFASRIETVADDGSRTALLIANGRMPAPSPDSNSVALAQTTSRGSGLMLWSRSDGSMLSLIPFGEFADIAYPRFSPVGDQIAFLVPEPFVGGSSRINDASCGYGLFGPCVALAHGLPWNLWIVGTDGSGARELAEVEADDASVAWSPDDSSLLVYGGSGGYLVDGGTGEVQSLPYLAGFGSIAWLSE